MSRTIHGASFKVLSHFREQSAALEVYWVYVARANYEGVAWPSGKQLAKDTGWNKDTCLDARRWLEKHGVIEPVEGYVKKKWRELPDNERQNKLNLDRSVYYRPTGTITIEGATYNLLYNAVGMEGEDQSESEKGEGSDVRSGRTTTAPDVRSGRTELDSSSSVLDSSKDSGAAKTAAATQSTFKQLQELVVDAWFSGNWVSASWAGDIVNMLLGKNDKKQYAEYNIMPPMDAVELSFFIKWYSEKRIDWVTAPKKLNQQIFEFRKQRATRPATVAIAPLPDADTNASIDAFLFGGAE
jgi:hypothetical protein